MIQSTALRAGVAALAFCAASSVFAQAIVPQPTPNADALAAQVRLLSANPRDVNALITAGELSARLADTDAAMAFFGRAEAIDPRNPRIAAGKASALVTMERPGEALRLFAQAEAAGLSMTPYLAQRGLAYDLTGQPGYAQRDYRRALQAGGDDETTRRLALSLGMSGKREEAMDVLDPLLRRSDRAAWRARAFVMALSGDMAGADRIAATTMPGGTAFGPFFRRLPTLSPADRAFAVHYGELGTSAARIADARLAPPVAVLPADPAPVAVAAVTPAPAPATKPRKGRRSREQTSLAGAQVARRDAKTVAPPTQPVSRAAAPVEVAARTTTAVPVASVPAPVRPNVAATSAASPTVSGPSNTIQQGLAAARTRQAPVVSASPPSTPSVPQPATTSPPAPVPAAPATTPRSASPEPVTAQQTTAPRAVPYQVIDAPGRKAPAVTPAVPPVAVRRRGNEALLASIIASIEVPSSELAARPLATAKPTPVNVAAAPRRVETPTPRPVAKPSAAPEKAAVADKGAPTAKGPASDTRATAVKADAKVAAAKADPKAASALKAAAAKAKPAPAKADTARWWVQIAGGARAGDLDKDWKRLTDKSTALKGKSAYVTPLRATNRLLTGPFKTEAEARGVVNALAKEGKSAFTFQSAAGQKVDRLDAR